MFNFLAGSVHSVAETLLILLDSTSEPIIPYNLHSACLSAVSNYNQCKQVCFIYVYLTFQLKVLVCIRENWKSYMAN